MSEKKTITVTLPTALLVAGIAGAAGYAIGSATASPQVVTVAEPRTQAAEQASPDPMGNETLPVGHPAVSGAAPGAMPAGHPAMSADPAGGDPAPSSLSWTAPARWQKAPNPSSMRLATYKIPKASGDPEDAELSVTQVGGGIEANIDRWVTQFEATGRSEVKRSERKVNGLTVIVVEISGTFVNGMDQSGKKANWSLLAAIVATPDMPHFFKITGPQRTVAAARPELDTLVASVKTAAP